MSTISVQEAAAILAAGAEHALFDIREPGEAERGHIAQATRLPRRLIELRLAALVARQGTTVLVYGGADVRAMLAARRMQQLGYTDVRVIEGGIDGWQAAGLPVITGNNVQSKLFGELVSEHEQTPQVDANELQEWRRAGREVLMCDIRTPGEYRGARIPGAVGTPGFDVALSAADLAATGKTLVVNCAGRTRSIIACETLRSLGISDVYALKNGTMGWLLSGQALEEGEGAGFTVPTPTSRAWARARAAEHAQAAGVAFVAADQLTEWLARRARGELNLYVFDVRQVSEYEAGHIVGTSALPGALAVQRTDEFAPVKAAQVVFVDDDETRALITAAWFRRMGFPNVAVLQGGVGAFAGPMAQGRDRDAALGLEVARATANATTLATARAAGAPLIIDVGNSPHFNKRHLRGAIWVPLGWLEPRIADIAPDRDQPILVSCADQVQSTFAAATLIELGYHNVSVLKGGTRSCDPADLALDEPSAPSDDDVVRQPYEKGLAEMQRYLEWEIALTHQPGSINQTR